MRWQYLKVNIKHQPNETEAVSATLPNAENTTTASRLDVCSFLLFLLQNVIAIVLGALCVTFDVDVCAETCHVSRKRVRAQGGLLTIIAGSYVACGIVAAVFRHRFSQGNTNYVLSKRCTCMIVWVLLTLFLVWLPLYIGLNVFMESETMQIEPVRLIAIMCSTAMYILLIFAHMYLYTYQLTYLRRTKEEVNRPQQRFDDIYLAQTII